MSETDEYVLGCIKTWVWSGFYGRDDIQEMIGDVLEHDADEAMLRTALESELATKATAKKTWPRLALALEGSLGGEDLLGEVLRRVRIGRRELTRRFARLEASATLAAELLSGQIPSTALPTLYRKPGAALAAEFHLGGVLVAALRAPHGSPPGASSD